MKRLPYILAALALLALASCTELNLGLTAAVGIVNTRPDPLPPPDLGDQIASHDSWCYATMGYPECYSRPVGSAGERLISVSPESNYPLSADAYKRISTPNP